jgi:hypothetical protein
MLSEENTVQVISKDPRRFQGYSDSAWNISSALNEGAGMCGLWSAHARMRFISSMAARCSLPTKVARSYL